MTAARGFTLIELLVVLAIAGLALAIMPVLLNSLPGAKLRAAADGVQASLRELHATALATGRSTALLVDPATRRITALPDGAPQALPPIVARVEVAAAAPPPAGTPGLFRFFPDGTATGGTITLRDGSRAAAIAVDWLTGQVRRAD